MFRRLFFLITIGLGINFATYSQCVTNATATLNYVSSSGANCTFNFTPSAIINNTPNVKMVQFTFPAGSSPSSVCYSGTPIALVPCSGSYTSISNNTTLVTLPLATITMPCSGSSLTYRAQTATNGTGGECTSATSLTVTGASPVRLSYFKGISLENKISLSWQTEVETNSSYFVVQRSGNAQEFGDLQIIKSKGESVEKTTYQFIDQNPFPGMNYYRLRQVDNDGSTTYSKIIDINAEGGASETLVYPNPGIGTFNVRSNETILESEVYNSSGKSVAVELEKSGDKYQLDFLQKPESGLYFLKLRTLKGIKKYRIVIY